MKYDPDRSPPGEPLALGHELAGPRDRHGDDRRPALDGQKEAAPAEGPQAAVAAARPLREDQERVAPLPHEREGPGDALLPALGALSVHGDEADEAHGEPDDGDAQDGLLQDDPGHAGNEHHDQGPVEEAHVIGHEDGGRPRVDAVEAGHFDADAQDAAAHPHGPEAEVDDRLAEPRHHAEDEERGDGDDEDRVEEDEKAGSHQSGPDYSTAARLYKTRRPAGIMTRKSR